MPLIPLIAVVGPTASGKTRLAVDIAVRYGGEVVSADSMQIYRGMDIGTAKPTKEEMAGVPHHMIDIVDPGTRFSVADYAAAARECIAGIHSRGKLPVLAGGTGLYVSAVIDNVKFAPCERDEQLRRSLRETARCSGGAALLAMLAEFDPEAASKLHPNNLGRIIRAIEVYRATGITITEQQRRSKLEPPCYRLCMLGLTYSDRAALYRRIDGRVDMMLERGLAGEAAGLIEKYGTEGLTSMQAIGYKETALYLDGRLSIDEAREMIKRETRHYAKRQLTWFRRDERVRWLDFTLLGSYENIWQEACNVIDKSGLI